MTLIEARRISEINEMVEERHEQLLKEAETYYENNIIDVSDDEEAQLCFRQLSLIDYTRMLKPEKFSDKSDEEILEHINMLETKYGDV